MKKKIQLTDFQKNVITYIALGGIAYVVYNLLKNKRTAQSQAGYNNFLLTNNIPFTTAKKVEEFANLICDPNLFVYPTEIASLINTMTDKELADFHLVYNNFYKGNLCDNLSPKELLKDEWGNYYQSTEQFLNSKGY